MRTLGEYLSSRRRAKNISFKKASEALLIKEEYLEALENSKWRDLPEPPFVKGFIRSYAKYLGLDSNLALAFYRREFDESKYPQKSAAASARRLMFTPNKAAAILFFLAVLVFIAYLIIQYLSILSAPKLNVFTPDDDSTTSIPFVEISGQTDAAATVAINGEFVGVSKDGNFSYQLKLEAGQNVIEIIASKKLSPKSKVVRVVRLIH